MEPGIIAAFAGIGLVVVFAPPFVRRIRLSRAKHRSLAGHPRIAKAVARLVPGYEYSGTGFFTSDGASPGIAALRRASFFGLAERLAKRAPKSVAATRAIAPAVSDLQFTSAYRVPFQYSPFVTRNLAVGALVTRTEGVRVHDLDGNAYYDVAGWYGLNVFGHAFYKSCLEAGIAKVKDLGPVLGAYHPVVADIVRWLREISGLDEVSFHMSGTEAVMQAVRLARYHTGRSHVVRFAGAYHGWWDGVQPGVGNPRPARETYTLKEMDRRTLRVLETRGDIACVLVNPLQALHPNRTPPNDGGLVVGSVTTPANRAAYSEWLRELREVCTARDIALVLDEVFVGFRLAYRGAQEYFGLRADLVTYGKTLGGGLPVGVLCGTSRFMRRFTPDWPANVCLARGTFNAHPYVMGTMHEFLIRVRQPAVRKGYEHVERTWNARAAALNAQLTDGGFPIRVVNLGSIWAFSYTRPSRYHWMLQFYLRAEGLQLSWVGTGPPIFSHDYTDTEFQAVADRILAAAEAMREGGWWSGPEESPGAVSRRLARELVGAALRRPGKRAHATS